MTVKFTVTQHGQPFDDYSWNEKTRIFGTKGFNVVIDFGQNNCITFHTGSHCTFKTGSHCMFYTGQHCIFDTQSHCTFDTGNHCTFATMCNCTFSTAFHCTFKTGENCIFTTGESCTFRTGYGCTFNISYGCTVTTGNESVIVRRDHFEVIQPEPNTTIKTNSFDALGYTIVPKTHTITIAGKDIELSEESFQAFKKQFNP